MSYTRPGRGMDLVANALLTHDVAHYQAGAAGVPVKQDNPKTLDSLASRSQIQSGVKYFLRVKGVTEQSTTLNAGLSGATVGAPVYINKTTDALSITPDTAGHTNVPFGRVHQLAGAFGVPTGKIQINMDLRDYATP